MAKTARFRDRELVPGMPKEEYWDSVLELLSGARSVEVIRDPGTAGNEGITLRVWFGGTRADNSNSADADSGAWY